MTFADIFALVGGVLGTAALVIQVRRALLERRKSREAPAPEAPRPDYRDLAVLYRTCPTCGERYETRSLVRAEMSCDPCVAKRFEASVEEDRAFWRKQGWEDAPVEDKAKPVYIPSYCKHGKKRRDVVEGVVHEAGEHCEQCIEDLAVMLNPARYMK